ncbi:low temperature requirement protein A [Halobaculum magnesiiphilum]|uniref:Low temperature requirement protein A n=1 Tax=Halobaculum magnesiiphilum TaxID=1017351 RepID=A0A8T8WHW5_9EURY|nr:low temperature requirement protein A [Halobaculum magnesiiphilum]QZP39333.1 low temperature requirement protein A [Halobaculum magnesiiphilum]
MQEQDVTPLELFFDLVFVFAFTQVTGFLVDHLTWPGMLRGAALLAALWWAWVTYSWLTGAVPAEERLPARLVILTAMSAMLLVALAVPGAFGDDGVLFGVAYFVVRALHVVLYAVATPPETRDAVLRAAPGFLGGPALLVVAGFFDGLLVGVLWIAALAIDYGIVFVRGVEGFHVNVGHFVERHWLVLIIALGESLVAIGVGAEGIPLGTDVVLAALLGIVLVIALWWLYFDYVVLAAERTLAAASGHEQTRMARDSYSYIHLLIVGSIIFIALGIEQTIAHVDESLGTIATVALFGGGALYLLGHNAFRYRDHGHISRERLVGTAVALVLIPVAIRVPAIVALGGITVLFVGLAAYETLRDEHRNRIRTG